MIETRSRPETRALRRCMPLALATVVLVLGTAFGCGRNEFQCEKVDHGDGRRCAKKCTVEPCVAQPTAFCFQTTATTANRRIYTCAATAEECARMRSTRGGTETVEACRVTEPKELE